MSDAREEAFLFLSFLYFLTAMADSCEYFGGIKSEAVCFFQRIHYKLGSFFVQMYELFTAFAFEVKML